MTSMSLPAFDSVMPSERLMAAVSVSDVESAKSALAAGANPNFNRSGSPVLLLAVAAGSPEIVEALLAKGADPNTGNRRDWLPIHEAARRGHEQIIAMFAKNPMAVLDLSCEGEVPLHQAATYGHTPAVSALLTAGASVDAPTHGDRRTPLMLAVENHHAETSKALLAGGANPDTPDASGRSARDRVADWAEGRTLFATVPVASTTTGRSFLSASDEAAEVAVEEEATAPHAHLGIGAVRKRTPR